MNIEELLPGEFIWWSFSILSRKLNPGQARPPIRGFKKLVKSCWPRPYISLIRAAGAGGFGGGGGSCVGRRVKHIN